MIAFGVPVTAQSCSDVSLEAVTKDGDLHKIVLAEGEESVVIRSGPGRSSTHSQQRGGI